MALDFDTCYAALREGDLRFDGRFFAGVVTTGVYCRSLCPVPQPAKARNVRLFACAAAAEDAGFRPCLRCHPERSPGTPIWAGFPPVVSRALRLIADGALDTAAVDALARRVGLGDRQLRRLFDEHLGTSPLAIAKARRVHFARRLLDETDLPLAQVAFTAGFGSIRAFNHDVHRTFGRSPRDLRATRGRRRVPREGVALRLGYRPPLDWPRMIAFMQPRAIRGVEVIEHDRYRRAIEIGGEPGVLEIRVEPHEPHLVLHVSAPADEPLIGIVERARRIFDLGADPLDVAAGLGRDPVLGRLVRARPGLRVPGAWDPFEVAVRAVLGQQISVRAATTLAARLVASFGVPLDGLAEPGLERLFPRPEALADADLGRIGATRAQAGTIRRLAAAAAGGAIPFDGSLPLEEFVGRMCELPGVGPWTAHYVAMRGVGDPDAFPSGDLGLRRAAGGGGTLSEREMERVAEAWRPWRAYAAMYLWTRDAARTRRVS